MSLIDAARNVYPSPCPDAGQRVGKACASRRLEDRARRAASPSILNERRVTKAQLSQIETRHSALSLESGLSTAFAAQVLGQILVTNRTEPALGARAYAAATRDTASERFIGYV